MKKIFSVGIIALFLINMSLVSAEVGGTVTRTLETPTQTYTSAEAFLEAEGNTCEVATDGCNTISINQGQFGATTLMYCEGEKVFSCLKEVEQATMCTMQYEPVCGIDGKTYGNSCMAQDMELAHEGVCEIIDILSENDRNFYEHVKTQLDDEYVMKAERVIGEYGERMNMLRWSEQAKLDAHTKLIDRVEFMISDLLMKYPQDIAIPDLANEIYFKLTLIKFELMLLDM